MKSMIRYLSALLLLPLAAGVSCQTGSFPGGRVCDVHHVKLEQRKVPIMYGLPPPPDKSAPSQQQVAALFPHRSREVNGGCMPMPEKTTKITVCPQCDAAYAEWVERKR